MILDMFREVLCSCSGGQIVHVLLQHLVSSLSVNGRTVRRLRADCSSTARNCRRRYTQTVFGIDPPGSEAGAAGCILPRVKK